MKNNSNPFDRNLVFIICGIAFFLRFYKLGFQSLWLDEIHTAIEAGSGSTWADLFNYLKCCDQHPPLFFIAEKLMFLVFGSNEIIARILPALAGTFSIWMIYLLGKEFYSSKLGLVAATLLCFNYFHINYSQEARPYSFAFLFTILSFLYLIRFIKNPGRKLSIQYAASTLLMIGSHYFGLFVLLAQIGISIFFWVYEEEKIKFLKFYALSGLIIFVCFIPWFPFLLAMSAIKSFWVKPVEPGFALNFFHEYFGNSDLLNPVLLVIFISLLIHLFTGLKKEEDKNIKTNPLLFSFLICFLWIVITFYIPYLRSLLVVPSLVPRYTIVLLPAIILLLALGIELISSNILKYTLLIFFCLLSLTDLFFNKKYYSQVSKTQFRELAEFIKSDTSFIYPVVSEITGWHQKYYLDKFSYPAPILEGNMEAIVDSIVHKTSARYDIEGFWLSDAHGASKPSPGLLKSLDSSFIQVRQIDLFDAWAYLFISKNSAGKKLNYIDYQNFQPANWVVQNQDTVIAIWDSQPVSSRIKIKKGKYKVNILFRGDPALGIYPRLNFMLDETTLGIAFSSEHFENHSFPYETNDDTEVKLKIFMDNDLLSKETKEDRNAFVKSLMFIRIE